MLWCCVVVVLLCIVGLLLCFCPLLCGLLFMSTLCLCCCRCFLSTCASCVCNVCFFLKKDQGFEIDVSTSCSYDFAFLLTCLSSVYVYVFLLRVFLCV